MHTPLWSALLDSGQEAVPQNVRFEDVKDHVVQMWWRIPKTKKDIKSAQGQQFLIGRITGGGPAEWQFKALNKDGTVGGPTRYGILFDQEKHGLDKPGDWVAYNQIQWKVDPTQPHYVVQISKDHTFNNVQVSVDTQNDANKFMVGKSDWIGYPPLGLTTAFDGYVAMLEIKRADFAWEAGQQYFWRVKIQDEYVLGSFVAIGVQYAVQSWTTRPVVSEIINRTVERQADAVERLTGWDVEIEVGSMTLQSSSDMDRWYFGDSSLGTIMRTMDVDGFVDAADGGFICYAPPGTTIEVPCGGGGGTGDGGVESMMIVRQETDGTYTLRNLDNSVPPQPIGPEITGFTLESLDYFCKGNGGGGGEEGGIQVTRSVQYRIEGGSNPLAQYHYELQISDSAEFTNILFSDTTSASAQLRQCIWIQDDRGNNSVEIELFPSSGIRAWSEMVVENGVASYNLYGRSRAFLNINILAIAQLFDINPTECRAWRIRSVYGGVFGRWFFGAL